MQSFEELLEKSVARHGQMVRDGREIFRAAEILCRLCAGEGYFHPFEEHSDTAPGFVSLKAHTL